MPARKNTGTVRKVGKGVLNSKRGRRQAMAESRSTPNLRPHDDTKKVSDSGKDHFVGQLCRNAASLIGTSGVPVIVLSAQTLAVMDAAAPGNALSPLLVFMAAEMDITTSQKGNLLSAIAAGYFFTQVPGGVLADWLGAKNVMTTAMMLSALCCLMLPVVVDTLGLSGLWCVMAVMGAVQDRPQCDTFQQAAKRILGVGLRCFRKARWMPKAVPGGSDEKAQQMKHRKCVAIAGVRSLYAAFSTPAHPDQSLTLAWVMAANKLTLKVSYQGEVRRLRDWPGEDEPSFPGLVDAALSLFDLSETHRYSIRYQDGDGTAVLLTQSNFSDALSLAFQDGLLRLSLEPPEEAPEQAHQPLEPTMASADPTGAEGPFTSGWSCFKEQVVSDFQMNRRDMQEAFRSSGEQHPALNVCGKVAGVTAGVCASARLIPLHGTRLAARSVAAAANMPVPESETPVPMATDMEADSDVQHFKQQVLQDFQIGRQEIQTAFGYFTGGSSSETASQPPRLGRDVLPAVASTVAGLTVATTLVPLRAARLVVASLAQRSEAQPEQQAELQAERHDLPGGATQAVSGSFPGP
ncbi:unnamed protein product [Symbiodinium necroappetens]|uniref:PB1 domain-containing protein n=1 Tax=Symbiodinium necroappetens TaxID=1628268 RepID=A0A812KST4_9DINO|nr:unnamed protein product [Symbiodinium necroappetens]